MTISQCNEARELLRARGVLSHQYHCVGYGVSLLVPTIYDTTSTQYLHTWTQVTRYISAKVRNDRQQVSYARDFSFRAWIVTVVAGACVAGVLIACAGSATLPAGECGVMFTLITRSLIWALKG